VDMQELEIAISPSGEVKIEVKGVHGDQCLDLTKQLENSLGTVEDRQLKSEYYEQNQNQNQQWNQGA
jgi:hypothetical protein